ncbi:MAG: DUF5717 family protein [Lachnospiraceae bacterium]|nr:DUF5717 family protein [Lachnospiraceae bacterium]
MQKQSQKQQISKYKYGESALEFSSERLEFNVVKGTKVRGSFTISVPDNEIATAVLYSNEPALKIETEKFSGSEAVIEYTFDATYLMGYQVVKGEITCISNLGEYYLPFAVSVVYESVESSLGVIKNLFHFANLCKSNWKEAVKQFYEPSFVNIFKENDTRYLNCYRGLSAHKYNEQNVEEFLIHIRKKQRITYEFSNDEIRVDIKEKKDEVIREEIVITRQGWGYTGLDIDVTGDFIRTDKKKITDDDFLGNKCVIPVYIDVTALNSGNHYGKITFKNAYISHDTLVSVSLDVNKKLKRYYKRKKEIAEIVRLYIDFRLKRIDRKDWLNETSLIVDGMIAADDKDIEARLYKARLLIADERTNEARLILDRISYCKFEQLPGAVRAYYLFLTNMLVRDKEFARDNVEEVKRIFNEKPTDHMTAFLLMHMSDEYKRDLKKRLALMERLVNNGCNSPIIYVEALTLMNNNPEILHKLSDFELRTLYFGAQYDALCEDLIEQFMYLSEKIYKRHPLTEKIYLLLYREHKDERILSKLCSALIKTCRSGHEFFEIFSDSVKADLRVTNLYEYFMRSMDCDKKPDIPKPVLMYYSFKSNLDYEKNAYLFSYVHRNRREYPELFETYRPVITEFVSTQLHKGNINENLAYLYSEYIRPKMIDEVSAENLSRMLFAHRIRIQNKNIRKIYIYHSNIKTPIEVGYDSRMTWIPLYDHEHTLILEDMNNNRFTVSCDYTIEKYKMPVKLLPEIEPYVENSVIFDAFMYERNSELASESNIRRVNRLIASEDVSPLVKSGIYAELLQYYYDCDNMRALDETLLRVELEDLNLQDRKLAIKYMVIRDMNDKAFEWIGKVGPNVCDEKTLVRLLDRKLKSVNMIYDETLTDMAAYTFFKGKYNGTILEYLNVNYNGLLKNLRDIWNAAKAFGEATFKLEEKMIKQMLYTGAFVGEKLEIFKSYSKTGGKSEVIEEYLAWSAREYFVKDTVTDRFIFEEIIRLYLRDDITERICRLAVLKYYAHNTELIKENELKALSVFITEFINEGVFLPCFKKYKGILDIPDYVLEKTVIEYKSVGAESALVHYIIYSDGDGEHEYRAEEMNRVTQGVFVKDFVLFYGEELQYYITDSDNEKEDIVESASIRMNDTELSAQRPGYGTINDMLVSRAMQDYETFDRLYEEHLKRRFIAERLFTIS